MFRKTLISATALAAIAFGAVSTAAASDNAREIEALRAAPVSLSQAVAVAEKKTGGHALRADFEKNNGAFAYEIRTATGEKANLVLVDPKSGKTLEPKSPGLLDRLANEFEGDDEAPKNARISLASAIASAEAHTGGKAMEAAYDDEDEHEGAAIRVDVAKDNTIHSVLIDGASGKVLKVTAEDREESED